MRLAAAGWGVPLPFFLHRESRELHPRTAELIEAVAQRVEEAGIEAWFALDPTELLGSEAADYDKMSDTLDVWFDSDRRTPASCAARTVTTWPIRPISISKAPTSTVAGFRARC